MELKGYTVRFLRELADAIERIEKEFPETNIPIVCAYTLGDAPMVFMQGGVWHLAGLAATLQHKTAGRLAGLVTPDVDMLFRPEPPVAEEDEPPPYDRGAEER